MRIECLAGALEFAELGFEVGDVAGLGGGFEVAGRGDGGLPCLTRFVFLAKGGGDVAECCLAHDVVWVNGNGFAGEREGLIEFACDH